MASRVLFRTFIFLSPIFFSHVFLIVSDATAV